MDKIGVTVVGGGLCRSVVWWLSADALGKVAKTKGGNA